jgi:Histidinol dehydrogenase
MPRHIKTAALTGQQEETDAKIRSTVESIIADVAKRGDAAVGELSEHFDKWSPASFRLPRTRSPHSSPRSRRRRSRTSNSRRRRSAILPRSSAPCCAMSRSRPCPASCSLLADSSCLMHQQGGAERIGVAIKFIHIAQILNGAST